MDQGGFLSSIPPVTKIYLGSVLATTLGVKLNYVQLLSLYFNPKLILQGEYWRLGSSFLFFGSFGIPFLFNLLFIYRYCKSLEEEHYRGKTAEFLIFCSFSVFLILIAGLVLNLPWLGMSFTQVFIYVWSRRNPFTLLNFLGFIIRAPYLPYVFAGLTFAFGGDLVDDLVGILVGHSYYFLEDIFPNLHGGFKILNTPEFMKRIFNENYVPPEVTMAVDEVEGEENPVGDGADAPTAENSDDEPERPAAE